MFVFKGDVGVPGFKGEAGPKGEMVSPNSTCRTNSDLLCFVHLDNDM